jgi:predicted transcriptional regulator
MSENKYSNGRTPSIWTVLPSRACNDIRFKKNPTTFLVLAQLGMYTNRAGVCWPNQITIAKNLGVTQSAISQHIKRLVQWGYISYLKRNKFHKNLKGNKYFMVFDENISPEEAISVQKTEHIDEVLEPMKKDIYTKPLSETKKKFGKDSYGMKHPSIQARKIILKYKEIVRQLYGHDYAVQHKIEHEHLVDTWLKDFSSEYILNKMESTLRYRLKNNQDSIKSVGYFKNVFIKNANKKPSSKKEELGQLLGKFKSTHKIKY